MVVGEGGGRAAVEAVFVDAALVCFNFGVDLALPEAHQGVQVAVLTLGFGALSCGGGVHLARFAEELDLLRRWVLAPEVADESGALVGDLSDGFGTSVVVDFGHGRLVHGLHATVQTVVSGLEGHLNESIRREAHGCDEVLAVRHEVKSLELVLVDEIRKTGFRKPQSGGKFGNHVPLQLVRCGADIAE